MMKKKQSRWGSLYVIGFLIPMSFALAEPRFQRNCDEQITYLSDVDQAYKYLEVEQRRIYESNSELTDPFSRSELLSPRSVNSFAELKARALKACPNPKARSTCALDPDMVDKIFAGLPCLVLPTRFEAPAFHALINLYTKELAQIRAKRFPASSETRFGSLPTGTFNAQAILPPGSKVPLVILNRDIFFFTGALSKSISDAIPIKIEKHVALDYSEAGIRQRLRERPYIVQNFADAMSRLVQGGSSRGAVEVTLDEPHNHLHARLLSGMDMFLIAHEESHVILKHVSKRSDAFWLAGAKPAKTTARSKIAASGTLPPTSNNLSNRQAETGVPRAEPATVLQEQVRTREQELKADEIGFKLMMWAKERSGNPIDLIVGAAAPHMVFRVLDAANVYGSEADGWTFSDPNHPSALERIKALEPIFVDFAKSNEALEVDFRIAFDSAFRVLLAESDPYIRQNLGLDPPGKNRNNR